MMHVITRISEKGVFIFASAQFATPARGRGKTSKGLCHVIDEFVALVCSGSQVA
jgi:hypothetical protein